MSPDLLPLCAACVGLEARRHSLVARALRTLLLGLGITCAVAALLGFVLEVTGWLPENFHVRGGGIGTLARVDLSTVLVAGVAGIAAILSFETRASAAVGVAISVTTIPAAAYAGVAFGLADLDDALPRSRGARGERGDAARGRHGDARRAAPAQRRRRRSSAPRTDLPLGATRLEALDIAPPQLALEPPAQEADHRMEQEEDDRGEDDA